MNLYELWLRLTTKEYWLVSKNYWLNEPRRGFKNRMAAEGEGNLYRMRYTRKHGWQSEYFGNVIKPAQADETGQRT